MNPARLMSAKLLVVCSAAVILSGCFGTATLATRDLKYNNAVNTVPDEYGVPAVAAQAVSVTYAPVVALRYVASVDPAHKQKIVEIYRQRNYQFPITGHEDLYTNIRYSPSALPEGIAKTAFHVMGLYRTLRKSLPNARIVLSPAELTINKSGKVAYKQSFRPIPADILIDFYAYVTPGVTSRESPRLVTTMGRRVAPIINIRTYPKASPSTEGALVIHKYLEPALHRDSLAFGVEGALGASLVDLLNAPTDDMPTLPRTQWHELISPERPAGPNKIVGLPRWAVTTYQTDGTFDDSVLYNAIANLTADIAHTLPTTRDDHFGYLGHAAIYDPRLYLEASGESILQVPKEHRAIIARLVEKEIELMEKASHELAKRFDDPNWREDFDKVRLAEIKELDENYNKLMTQAFAGWATGNVAMVNDLENVMRKDAKSGEERSALFFGETSQPYLFTVKIGKKATRVRANSIDMLRQKLSKLYAQHVGSPWKESEVREYVKEFQVALADKGYSVGRPDGLVGRRTRDALKQFQREEEAYADGFLVPSTLSRLKAN